MGLQIQLRGVKIVSIMGLIPIFTWYNAMFNHTSKQNEIHLYNNGVRWRK